MRVKITKVLYFLLKQKISKIILLGKNYRINKRTQRNLINILFKTIHGYIIFPYS